MRGALEHGEVERFRGIVASCFGLQFEDSRLGFLADVLRQRVHAGPRDSRRYLQALEEGPRDAAETGALAEALTVNETYFFRNSEQFRALHDVVIPDRMRARAAERRLRLLSAGCATGDEAYTLAMVLREGGPGPGWDVSIRAADLNPAVLDRARAASYSAWALRETPPEMQDRWFRAAGRDFLLDEAIREAVTFEQRNLTADDAELWKPGHYDVIFCRNVIMYFSPDTMREVVARLSASLAPGGYLFIGHAETLRGLTQDFELLHSHDTFYYRRRVPGEEKARLDASRHADMPVSAITGEKPAGWMQTIAQAAERIRVLEGTPPADAVRAAPNDSPQTSWPLGHATDLLRLERFAEALDVIRALPEEASRDEDVLLLTAVLLVHSGQLAVAAEVAQRLLACDGMSSGAHYVLALARAAAGDLDAAVRAHHFAAHLDPGFAMPRVQLGILARRRGDRALARRELNQAMLLLHREDAARLLLFGGGFTRDGLLSLCRSELATVEGRA